jgi:hypothetical protein
MPTNTLQVGLGIIGTTFIVEREHGWSLYISQVNSSNAIVEQRSVYSTFSPSTMISYMKIRYIVSSHPYIDIDYFQQTFSCIIFLN